MVAASSVTDLRCDASRAEYSCGLCPCVIPSWPPPPTTAARRRSAAGLPCPSRGGSGCWCWSRHKGLASQRCASVDWVRPPAFAACNHVACRPDILLGVVLTVEPPAPPHRDIACETLPGLHGISTPASASRPLVYRPMRKASLVSITEIPRLRLGGCGFDLVRDPMWAYKLRSLE